jgi:hypothetical protein
VHGLSMSVLFQAYDDPQPTVGVGQARLGIVALLTPAQPTFSDDDGSEVVIISCRRSGSMRGKTSNRSSTRPLRSRWGQVTIYHNRTRPANRVTSCVARLGG